MVDYEFELEKLCNLKLFGMSSQALVVVVAIIVLLLPMSRFFSSSLKPFLLLQRLPSSWGQLCRGQQRCCCCVTVTIQSIGCFSVIMIFVPNLFWTTINKEHPQRSNHHHHRAASPQGRRCCCCIKNLVTIQSIGCSVIFAPKSNSFWTTINKEHPQHSNHHHRAVTFVADRG